MPSEFQWIEINFALLRPIGSGNFYRAGQSLPFTGQSGVGQSLLFAGQGGVGQTFSLPHGAGRDVHPWYHHHWYHHHNGNPHKKTIIIIINMIMIATTTTMIMITSRSSKHLDPSDRDAPLPSRHKLSRSRQLCSQVAKILSGLKWS